MAESESTQQSPQEYQRSERRIDNDAVFGIDSAAITLAKDEDPKGHEGRKNHAKIALRVTKQRVKDGLMTEEEREDWVADFAAAMGATETYDPNTGAFSNASIIRYANKKIEEIADLGKEHVLVAFDIDSLGRMNRESKNHHESADRALFEFVHFHAAELMLRFGYQARLGRLARAGDEFACVIPNTTVKEVEDFFNEIEEKRREEMSKIVLEEELPVDITAGRVIVGLKQGDSFDSAYQRADAILMDEKTRKRASLPEAA